ncbi:signal recognition particle protein [Chloroflexota bacterium]
MMFDNLSDKLSIIVKTLNGRGRLSEKDLDEALREVRLAFLEADVNFKVVKDFTGRVKARLTGSEIFESLSPAQHIIKVVNEELVATLGGSQSKIIPGPQTPSVILMAGLQGSGKTTTAAKLALHLERAGKKTMLVAADNRRPAAIEQLETLAKQHNIIFYAETPSEASVDISKRALKKARTLGIFWVIIDTAGRLNVEQELMDELTDLRDVVKPAETILVVDGMTGQDAVNIALGFNERLKLTGIILTKMDGDARGGAALSMRWVTGVPIKFIGTGERPEAFEPFYPERLASRILGMGDMLTFIEKAQTVINAEKAADIEKKMNSATFGLDDFLVQLRSIRQMGPIGQLMGMLPGVAKLSTQIPEQEQEKRLKKVEAIILSMTPAERKNPAIIGGNRRKRIARGSGTGAQDVNQVLNQFHQMRKLMKLGTKSKLARNIVGGFR